LSKEAQRSGLKLVSLGGNEYDSTLVENFGVLNRSDSFDIMSRSRVCVTPTRFESFSTIGLEAIYLGASLIAPLDSPQGELAEELHLRIDMGKPGLDSTKPPSRKDTQVKLARKFGIKQIKQALEDVYVDA
jgi:hypothetical protein